jgi:DNA repair protein RecO (recombination protein O)
MPLVDTDAIVLHAFDYLETSRILRLATRDAGVQSVIAKGARRARTKHATAIDLFAEGSAQFSMRPGRDLQTLTGFDVTRVRVGLAADLARFSAASAIAELVLRFGNDEAQPELFTLLAAVLDALAIASAADARRVALGGAWRLVAAFGFAPSLDQCARCLAPIPDDATAAFSQREGGVLCANCARGTPGVRVLPLTARRAIMTWLADGDTGPLDDLSLRAHQRLLREFVHEHLTDGRPLRAWDSWEKATWAGG